MKNSEKKRQQLLEEIAALRAQLAEHEDAEAKRKPTEERSRIILQTAMDGFCIVDTQGDFKDVNEAYCRITGYTRDELLSMNVRDIEALETMAETAEHLEKIKKSGVERFETCLKRKDGELDRRMRAEDIPDHERSHARAHHDRHEVTRHQVRQLLDGGL